MTEREIREPDNSTVDNWFGQQAAHDADIADDAVAETGGDLDEAQGRYEQRADGEEKYDKGRRRPWPCPRADMQSSKKQSLRAVVVRGESRRVGRGVAHDGATTPVRCGGDL